MSSHDPADFSDSDREWLNALGGRAVAPDSAAAREGFALRTALEQLELAQAPTAAPPQTEAERLARRERLLQMAVAAGAFERPAVDPNASGAPKAPQSNVVEFPWWRRRRPALALAASLAVGSVLLTQTLDRTVYGPPPETFGTPAPVQRLQTEQPREAAEALAARLRAAGLKPGLYQRGKTFVVDITLLASEVPPATAAFEPLALRPAPGFNRVEFAPR